MKPTSFTLPLTWSSPSGSALGWGGGGRWGHTAGRLAAHSASLLLPPLAGAPGPAQAGAPRTQSPCFSPCQDRGCSAREIFNPDKVGIKSSPSPGARCPLPPSPAQPSWVSSPLLPMSQARGGPLPAGLRHSPAPPKHLSPLPCKTQSFPLRTIQPPVSARGHLLGSLPHLGGLPVPFVSPNSSLIFQVSVCKPGPSSGSALSGRRGERLNHEYLFSCLFCAWSHDKHGRPGSQEDRSGSLTASSSRSEHLQGTGRGWARTGLRSQLSGPLHFCTDSELPIPHHRRSFGHFTLGNLSLRTHVGIGTFYPILII